ncbi:MAG: hypothetical protein K1X56_05415 [Flavobacteriales bacterium]|nr:hypothetical protein [Flavobacteriales bacterium]
MKKTIFFASMILAIACGAPKVATTTAEMNQSDADRAAAKFPGTTLADLQKGKTIYEANCGKCHKLHAPNSRGEEGWKKIVPPMAKKAKLDDASMDLTLKYLVTMSEVK